MFIDYSESEYAYILYAETMSVDAPWDSKISNPLSFSAIAAMCRALNRKQKYENHILPEPSTLRTNRRKTYVKPTVYLSSPTAKSSVVYFMGTLKSINGPGAVV